MMAMLIQREIARAALNRGVTGLEQIGRVAGYLLPVSPGLASKDRNGSASCWRGASRWAVTARRDSHQIQFREAQSARWSRQVQLYLICMRMVGNDDT